MRSISTVICILFLSSCATLINERHITSTIHSDDTLKVVYGQDTLQSSKNRVKIRSKRSSEPIEFTVLKDSLSKTFTIYPKNSFAYEYGNILGNYGIGMLIEKDNPKRYSYPKNLYINTSDGLKLYVQPTKIPHKGRIFWRVSLPYFNSLLQHPLGEGRRINSGFWGISSGFDFHHQEHQFINVTLGASATLFLPIIAAVDFVGEKEVATSAYFTFNNNHQINRFSIGYGLSLSQNNWAWRYYDFFAPPPTRPTAELMSYAFGLNFPTYYRLGKRFHVGFIYRPSFLQINATESTRRFQYEHLITIDLSWKIGF
ncbi:MAG: hypothetical protein AAF985_17005 [Bacteroidota bacterium]